MTPPHSRQRQWVLIAGLAAVIVLTLLANNAHYFFRAQLFEQGDFASNSLTVLQAKKFRAVYGNYSRWGFHHPGPAFFYCYAAGETLLYDWLRLVPTPFNAQAIAGLILAAGFFAGAVGTAARWVGRGWFVPITLLFGVLHFGATTNPTLGNVAFLLVWPPCVMLMPFLCLLVAGASVGAGRGEDLPLLALACGFLVHSHVAQPLFVLPVFALAYAGLAWACWRGPGRPPWKETPRAHALALGVVAVFILPIAVDLCHGKDGNFALIREHMRTHQGERHAWTDALGYLLDFSAYRPYRPGYYETLDGGTLRGIGTMLARHPETTLLWTAALGIFLTGLALQRRAVAWAGVPDGGSPAATAHAARWRYLRWLGALLVVNVALTLFWAHIQDGGLFFFNAFFNYSLYFALAMLAAGALAGGLELVAPPGSGRQRWGAVGICALAALSFLWRPERFQTHFFDTAQARDFARNVRTAIRDDGLAPGDTRYLRFFPQAWDEALTVALRLERDGYAFRVAPDEAFLFGAAHTVKHPVDALLAGSGSSTWRVDKLVTGPGSRQIPLDDRYGLDWWSPTIDPTAGAVLFFDGSHHPAVRTAGYDEKADATAYVCSGFTPPDDLSPYVVNDQPEAVMSFPAPPVADGAAVELTADLFPLCFPGVRDRRRLQVFFNGQLLGDWTLDKAEPVRVQIPAALWNARPKAAVLQWRFPDAVSAVALGVSKDPRPLAFGFRKLEFSVPR